MEIFNIIFMFIIGTIFGSFYNVVGYRIPKGESIINPPSHCPNCNHRLAPLELIPIISYIISKGKCKNCKQKISPFYIMFESLTGILFSLSYIIFGFTTDIIIPLTFISMLIIIIVSDYNYMIINDSILIIFSIILIIEILLIYGPYILLKHIISAILAFITMFLLKKTGDFLFKKESMGGGDIKLLGVFGLVIGYPMSLMTIFLGAIIALPISLITIKDNQDHIIPFGPFLALGAIIVLLSKINLSLIITFLQK
ncbi:MAG: prepilin peptidase [Bacilli bacterium]|nr:prepilin peptidase [Bacilli bacterium]